MTPQDEFFDTTTSGCVLRVHVQPASGRDMVSGRYGDALRVRLKAKPQDGAANKALLAFLGRELGVPKTRLQLVSGLHSRRKRVAVPLAAPLLRGAVERLLAQSEQHVRNSE